MNKIKRTNLVVIEAGHLSKQAVSGGDKLIKAMIPYLQKNTSLIFTIVIPQIAKNHWLIKNKPRFHILPPIFLEKYPNIPLAVFIIYLWRSIHLFKFLITIKRPYILYSSSAEIVDWLIPFLIKSISRRVKWVIRIHHLKETPMTRPGDHLINSLSFLIDKVGLFCFKKADLVILLNNNLKKRIVKSIPSSKIKILGAGIDLQKINNFKANPKSPSYDAIFLGRVHYTKGPLDLPKIWNYVKQDLPEAKLAIIGELSIPKLTKQLKEQIMKANLQKSIKVLGHLPQNQTLSILKNSKVFLFTDHEAGFGLAAAEAMAAGLPVIGWDIGVLGNVFKRGFIKISFNNHREFAANVVDLLKNPNLYTRLSQEARFEAQKFGWGKVSKKFDYFLKSLTND